SRFGAVQHTYGRLLSSPPTAAGRDGVDPDTHQRRLDQCQVGPELAVDGQACTARGRYDGIDARYRGESSGLSTTDRAKAGVGLPNLPAGRNRLSVQRRRAERGTATLSR